MLVRPAMLRTQTIWSFEFGGPRLRRGLRRTQVLASPDEKYFLNSFFELRVREPSRTTQTGIFLALLGYSKNR